MISSSDTNAYRIGTYRNSPLKLKSKDIFTDESVLYYVDFSIQYLLKNSSVSRLFPIRIIDDSYLADVLNDWVLAPRMRTPVMVIYGTENNTDSTFELYVGENDEITSITGTISSDGAHLPISCADSSFNMLGGHLKESSLVDTTAEIVILEFPNYNFKRKLDPNTGYKELVISSNMIQKL